MTLPFPNLDHRKLSMREQVIERLLELNPITCRCIGRSKLETLKDFALLQALEVAIELRAERSITDHGREMFNAGMNYEREHAIKNLSHGGM